MLAGVRITGLRFSCGIQIAAVIKMHIGSRSRGWQPSLCRQLLALVRRRRFEPEGALDSSHLLALGSKPPGIAARTLDSAPAVGIALLALRGLYGNSTLLQR